MIRLFSASAAVFLTATITHAGDAHTTRILPAQVFGATVTLEQGVRVFRPLPPNRHVIINPEGETEIEFKIHEYNATPPGRIRR